MIQDFLCKYPTIPIKNKQFSISITEPVDIRIEYILNYV